MGSIGRECMKILFYDFSERNLRALVAHKVDKFIYYYNIQNSGLNHGH